MMFLITILLLSLVAEPQRIGYVASTLGTEKYSHTFSYPKLANSSQLQKRVADLTWDAALAGGQTMLDKIRGQRAQTPWNSIDQLDANGWAIGDGQADDWRTADYNKPGGPYASLGIVQDDGQFVAADQDKSFANCYKQDNQATGAYFEQVYNVPGKAIIGVFNYSPLYQVGVFRKGWSREQLMQLIPDAHRWSEIVWVIWQRQAQSSGADPSSLKYIFKHGIITENTKHIMDLAVSAPENGFSSDYPGETFARGSEQYQALMGTPHGKSMAWLLIDHPNELAEKVIDSITMFTTEGKYQLLFTLSG